MTLEEIIKTLEPLARDHDPGYLYWITASPSPDKEDDLELSGTVDTGETYCEECAEAEIERMEAIDPDGEYGIQGGESWGSMTSDGFDFCSKCASPLWVSLTVEGARDELENFKRWVGNLHADSQACGQFIEICETIPRAENTEDRTRLETEAMNVYHQMQQLMDLYVELSPTKDLLVWFPPLPYSDQIKSHARIEAPYCMEEKPVKDQIFVNQAIALCAPEVEYQEWKFKNTHPHIIEQPMHRLTEIKGVGQPSDEPLTHQEFLVAIACFALADGRPGVPFSSSDILPFLNVTGLNGMSVEEAKEVGDAIIRNAHYRQSLVRKLREVQPVN